MVNEEKYIGKLLDDRYEQLELIGSGGMSVVYKSLDRKLNRYDAIKILKDDLIADDESRERFLAESRAIAMLSHPNIVSIYDVGHSDDVGDAIEYIVMELIDGITLKQYIKKRGQLNWKESLHFSAQIAKALAHAHEKGIIHRDIKPQNIMLLKDGTIKVADFGIAALQNSMEDSDEALGSVHYMAPEQSKGAAADARSDIYSLGVVMYEMLTGQYPYTGETPEEIAIKHINGNPVRPRKLNKSIPVRLEKIILKAMSSDLQTRYQTAEEMVQDLEKFRQEQVTEEMKSSIGPIDLEGKDPVPEPKPPRKTAAKKEGKDKPVPEVAPIRNKGDLSKENFKKRRRRSRKVTMLTGVFCVLLLILALVAFLWNFWLKDLFSASEKVEIPDFSGQKYEDVINNKEYKGLYNFSERVAIDTEHDYGTIIGQTPAAHKNMSKLSNGIDIEFTISSGYTQVEVPAVGDGKYTGEEAKKILEDAGFVVQTNTAPSGSIKEGYVISCTPETGTNQDIGSTITILISSGPEKTTVEMPELEGKNITEARAIIEENRLKLSDDITYTPNSGKTSGTIIGQVPKPGVSVSNGTTVYVEVAN
ncbi:MAG: Stk1 family PASTA domain-containing Ser/Thr kinase [Oscillospiraceae bacterium]|nr:Stk1 family PASTA domain-containing Ser/Thr kinase [Oscillospiraceae bacterium]